MRIVYCTIPTRTYRVIVYRIPQTREYMVRLFYWQAGIVRGDGVYLAGGKWIPDVQSDYFTDDLDDAIGTAHLMQIQE